MNMDINDNNIIDKIKELALAGGVEIVESSIFHAQGQATVRVIVDYPDGGVTMDVCAGLNKSLNRYLEETSLLGDNFLIEVNSPGLDRKLKTVNDFKRVLGRNIMLWLKEKVDGKDYHEGVVRSVDENNLVLGLEDKELIINFSLIITGKEKIVY